MTERQASMWSVLSMSKTNWGFFRMFTQNRRGRLWGGGDRQCEPTLRWGGRGGHCSCPEVRVVLPLKGSGAQAQAITSANLSLCLHKWG